MSQIVKYFQNVIQSQFQNKLVLETYFDKIYAKIIQVIYNQQTLHHYEFDQSRSQLQINPFYMQNCQIEDICKLLVQIPSFNTQPSLFYDNRINIKKVDKLLNDLKKNGHHGNHQQKFYLCMVCSKNIQQIIGLFQQNYMIKALSFKSYSEMPQNITFIMPSLSDFFQYAKTQTSKSLNLCLFRNKFPTTYEQTRAQKHKSIKPMQSPIKKEQQEQGSQGSGQNIVKMGHLNMDKVQQNSIQKFIDFREKKSPSKNQSTMEKKQKKDEAKQDESKNKKAKMSKIKEKEKEKQIKSKTCNNKCCNFYCLCCFE